MKAEPNKSSMESINFLRDSLIDLPRKELQAKAKAIGIAANLKTSEIIELILQHSQKIFRTLAQTGKAQLRDWGLISQPVSRF